MSIQLAIPARFSVEALVDEPDSFDEDRLSTDDAFLDSPIDELGEAAAIRDLYQTGVADEHDE